MIKRIFAHADRYDLKQYLIWSLAPGATLTIAMLVMTVVLEPRGYRAVAAVAAVAALAATVVSAKELVEHGINSWFIDARRIYAQGEAKRAEERGRLIGQIALLEKMLATPGRLDRFSVLLHVEPRVITWLSDQVKNTVLELSTINEPAAGWPKGIVAALKTQRCLNCGTPLNGVDHSIQDCC